MLPHQQQHNYTRQGSAQLRSPDPHHTPASRPAGNHRSIKKKNSLTQKPEEEMQPDLKQRDLLQEQAPEDSPPDQAQQDPKATEQHSPALPTPSQANADTRAANRPARPRPRTNSRPPELRVQEHYMDLQNVPGQRLHGQDAPLVFTSATPPSPRPTGPNGGPSSHMTRRQHSPPPSICNRTPSDSGRQS